MNWYEKCDLIIHEKNTYMPDHLERIKSDDPPLESPALISQFFLTPIVLHQPNTFVSIPTPNPSIYQYVISQISVHFNKVLAVYHNGQPVEVSMQYLKENSEKYMHEIIENHNLHPIIYELYGSTDRKGLDSAPTDIYTIRILNESINCLHDELFDTVWDFINDTYMLDKGVFSISVDWVFGEDLSHSKFLAYLCKYNVAIYLDVDRRNDRVRMIHVKQK